MEWTRLLVSGANASVVVFVVSSTLAVGLRLTVGQILTPLRNGRLVAASLLASFVLSPLLAIALASVLGLDEPLRVGLLLCGVAAGAPFVLKLAELARGHIPFSVGLVVVLMVVTVGYVPFVLPMLLAGVRVDSGAIARSLILLMLIPLAFGLGVRARYGGIAARLAPVVSAVSSISMICVVALTTAGHFQSVLGVLGTYAILAAVVFTGVCVGFGWVLGGPSVDTRTVLALGTAQRNTAAALVVASQNFRDPNVIVMITVVMIIAFAMLVPLSWFFARPKARTIGVRATAGR